MSNQMQAMRELSVEEIVEKVREQTKFLEKDLIISLKTSRYKGEQAYAGQHAKMEVQTILAIRALEDARMRCGKILQYAGDGESIYDKMK